MRSIVSYRARASGWLSGDPPQVGLVASKFDAGKFRLMSTPLALSRVAAARPSGLASSRIVRVTASAPRLRTYLGDGRSPRHRVNPGFEDFAYLEISQYAR